jgi:Protein of unknown function (DUF4242)
MLSYTVLSGAFLSSAGSTESWSSGEGGSAAASGGWLDTKKGDVPTMALFMDVHHHVDGLTAEAVAGAHERDLEVQSKYGVKYLKYWFDEGTGKVFCLVEAPNKEAAEAVHREAHGLVADEITEVMEGA